MTSPNHFSSFLCPVCGATLGSVHSFVHCPAYHPAMICESHCSHCGYLDNTCSVRGCRWRSREQKISEKRKAQTIIGQTVNKLKGD